MGKKISTFILLIDLPIIIVIYNTTLMEVCNEIMHLWMHL